VSGLADGPVEREAADDQPDSDVAAGASEPSDGRRSRGRAWLGLAVGIVIVSGALVVVLNDPDDEGGDGDPVPSVRTPGQGASQSIFEWPASYAGPVWITVDAADAAPRTITIRWGPWERRIVHEGADPVTYEFSKNPGETVPTTVRVDPAAEVSFGSGTPPVDAVDVNAGWTQAADD
jgi:hypothetical protein